MHVIACMMVQRLLLLSDTELYQYISLSILHPDLNTMNKTAMNFFAQGFLTNNRRFLNFKMEVPFCFLVLLLFS